MAGKVKDIAAKPSFSQNAELHLHFTRFFAKIVNEKSLYKNKKGGEK